MKMKKQKRRMEMGRRDGCVRRKHSEMADAVVAVDDGDGDFAAVLAVTSLQRMD